MATEIRPPNHLIHEKSPYLQQHAHNPVDWYPWEKPIFDLARKRNEREPDLLTCAATSPALLPRQAWRRSYSPCRVQGL
ncbi:MAG: DUF255 domain-containing protein [Acidobacteria bacterium]|nr:DUF255 domain-containing protein [Acidobacteriota bacterium]